MSHFRQAVCTAFCVLAIGLTAETRPRQSAEYADALYKQAQAALAECTAPSFERARGLAREAQQIFQANRAYSRVGDSLNQTGRGATPGEGMQGLSRAFFFAGAHSLVASLWKVEDSATAQLMARFYEYLRQGYSKTESLHLTKKDLIRDAGMDPRLWAAFVLFGEPAMPIPLTGPRPISSKTPYVAGTALIFVALLVTALVFRRRDSSPISVGRVSP